MSNGSNDEICSSVIQVRIDQGLSHEHQLVLAAKPASAWICKKNKNALSSGYQDLMGHMILTTSP